MISDIIIDQEDDLVLYKRETIEDAFNRYLTKNDIKIYKNKNINFYVQRGKEYIKLDKIKKIEELNINLEDIIEVKEQEDVLETTSAFIYNTKKPETKKKNNTLITILIIFLILLLFTAIFLICYFLLIKKKKRRK